MQASPSSQTTSATFTQPDAGSQLSVVHPLPSSQLTVVPGSFEHPVGRKHVSSVQAFPSSQSPSESHGIWSRIHRAAISVRINGGVQTSPKAEPDDHDRIGDTYIPPQFRSAR